MKDQNVGDTRGYLKYHLLETLVREVPTVDRLTILWMLTPSDTSNDGNVHLRPHAAAESLADFLAARRGPEDRAVRHMREYFAQQGITYHPHGDEPPYFDRSTRDAYFRDIPQEHLDTAVVFLDPDNGLTRNRPSDKHVGMAELKALYGRLGVGSILVLIQFQHRKPDFWNTWGAMLQAELEAPVRWVSAPLVAFYVMPKGDVSSEGVDGALHRVADSGRSCRFGSVAGAVPALVTAAPDTPADFEDMPAGGPDPANACPNCGATPMAPADGMGRWCPRCDWSWMVGREKFGRKLSTSFSDD